MKESPAELLIALASSPPLEIFPRNTPTPLSIEDVFTVFSWRCPGRNGIINDIIIIKWVAGARESRCLV